MKKLVSTTTILMEFLKALDASLSAQSGQVCCLSARYIMSKELESLFPTKHHISTLQPLDLDIIECFKDLYRKCQYKKLCS